jgi:adenylate kinase
MHLIFLAGIHGVGKSYLGTPVAKNLGMDYFTASQLIREEKGRATWGVDKHVAEIDDNQLALIRAVARKRSEAQSILLDGHFVLRGQLGELIRLEKNVFAELKFSAVILLTENPQTVARRIEERDGVTTDHASITNLANEEYSHAHDVCGTLGVPLKILFAPTEQIFADTLGQLLGRA